MTNSPNQLAEAIGHYFNNDYSYDVAIVAYDFSNELEVIPSQYLHDVSWYGHDHLAAVLFEIDHDTFEEFYQSDLTFLAETLSTVI